MIPTEELIVLLACYAIGCIASAYYLVRLRTGGDVRELGSGTSGARNVGRVLGVRWAVGVALLDIGRGAAALALARAAGLSGPALVAATGAVVSGHLWPAQLGFRGGKGVAVSYGAILALDPWMGLALWGLFLPLWWLCGRTSLAGLGAFTLGPFLALALGRGNVPAAALALASALILWAHRADLAATWGLRNASPDGTDVVHPASRRSRP